MKNAVISFAIFALIGFGLGYLAFEVIGKSEQAEPVAKNEEQANKPADKTAEKPKEEPTDTAADGDNILQAKGCLGCHSVSGLNLQGGATGPDLSTAFTNVEGKHGKPLDEFLKEPTSAVMSGVIGGNPLSDDEIQQVVKILQEASQK